MARVVDEMKVKAAEVDEPYNDVRRAGVTAKSTPASSDNNNANVITLSATHMVPDPKLSLAREKVQIDFFRQHLGPP